VLRPNTKFPQSTRRADSSALEHAAARGMAAAQLPDLCFCSRRVLARWPSLQEGFDIRDALAAGGLRPGIRPGALFLLRLLRRVPFAL
jgi:hypothetical protein